MTRFGSEQQIQVQVSVCVCVCVCMDACVHACVCVCVCGKNGTNYNQAVTYFARVLKLTSQ